MKILSLNGTWELDIPNTHDCNVTASVPGTVYSDLFREGKMEDPFYRDNEDKALALMEHEFHYSRSFPVSQELMECAQVLLRCEGLDTIASVYVNGILVGNADNMHRIWEYDVKSALHLGENRICIIFSSPTKYIRQAYQNEQADGSDDALIGFPLIRKAHCMYGWDWGPKLPDAGIWRNISVIGVEQLRIRDVRVTQDHHDGKVDVHVKTNLDSVSGQEEGTVRVTLTSPDGEIFTAQGDCCTITVEDPKLWWPNGFGRQPLYRIVVELSAQGTQQDCWERRIGLRTMTIHRQKDAWGESFCHRVNGVDIFAMGADYIPEDNLFARINPERTRRLLTDAAEANMNTIRVWGGGYYPDDYFYDICDELGLMVWQDFMFACAVYNLTDAFEENITKEFVDNIRRLRHHASLALWCGNNEMELFIDENMWVSSPRQKADYIKMYEYIIPKILKQEDPETFYWPASPSSGGSFDMPNDENRGDVHYWDVWHGLKPFTEYRKFFFRYVSEFGFQSFPCMKTIESFTAPEDRNVFSYVMEKHQRNKSANGKIVSYLSQMYLYPHDLDTLSYASQLLQAQAVQFGVEHWRRNRGRCMGAIIWQLNDCWPVASWASIDYFGRWKALHYYAKRFFAPVLISCCEEGVLTQNTNVNAELYDLKKRAHLNVCNETMEPFRGTVHYALRRPDASEILSGKQDVEVPALSSLWLDELDFSDQDTYGCYFSYALLDTEGRITGQDSVLFCPPKHFRFEDPHLKARIEGNEIVVEADAYARSVELCCDADTVLQDNYFHMDGGVRKVRIVKGDPRNVHARSVFDIR